MWDGFTQNCVCQAKPTASCNAASADGRGQPWRLSVRRFLPEAYRAFCKKTHRSFWQKGISDEANLSHLPNSGRCTEIKIIYLEKLTRKTSQTKFQGYGIPSKYSLKSKSKTNIHGVWVHHYKVTNPIRPQCCSSLVDCVQDFYHGNWATFPVISSFLSFFSVIFFFSVTV